MPTSSSPPTTTRANKKSANTSPPTTTRANSMTSSKLSAPTIASRRIPLKLQLDAELKNTHTIQWQTDKLDSPLVIRYKDKDVKTEIKRWAKAITTVTGQKVEQSSKTTYVRINLVAEDVTMYASIYGTATVMFQGKGYEQWLKDHVRLCVN